MAEPIRVERVLQDVSPEALRRLTAQQAGVRETVYGNLDVTTRVTARSKNSTFIVSDNPELHTNPVISRSAYRSIVHSQARHLLDIEVIVLDGYIGDHPDARVATRLVVDSRYANLAAMQQLLYFAPDFDEPEFTVIYTPALAAPGYPDDRLITVDLEEGVTRVLGSDYFGEAKMGGLRMWDALMYRRGGLALHSGLKRITLDDGTVRDGLIIGLSGTGKTTTTFSQQGKATNPVQDDFVALFPDGRVYGTEAGTFAKTYGITPQSEPAVFDGVKSPRAYLENVALTESGEPDFFDRTHTENGRAVIGAADIAGMIPPREVEKANFMLILNRSASVVPPVAKLGTAEQAAAYFMLGETTGTSAGGVAEAGKFLRVPGTNPFFCYRHEEQGNRMLELLQGSSIDVYVLNTGRIGGLEQDERSRDVLSRHSAAIVQGIAEGTIIWARDRDFGYLVAEEVPGIEERELLIPRDLYTRQGRLGEYRDITEELVASRREHLKHYAGLAKEIGEAI